MDQSSGNSYSDVSKNTAMTQTHATENVSSMYAMIRDTVTDTDNPLPATEHVDEFPLPSDVAEISFFGEVTARRNQDASASSSSLSNKEE